MCRLASLALVAALVAGLGACTSIVEVSAPAPEAQARPDKPRAPSPSVARPTSLESARLRARLTEIQSAQLTQGLLRRDGGGPDTPYTSTMLARNFTNIAFFDEYTGLGRTPGGAGTLRRWESPVVVGIEFGASVPPSQKTRDRMDVRRFAARLARTTGHSVSVGSPANFIVAFLSEDDRGEALGRIAARLPGINEADLGRLRKLPDDVYCVVLAYPSATNPSAYAAAVAIIRAENPDLLRLSCIHEEMAQGMGLANDSPEARPSIFNDDDEFALLTSHDETLLNMLYDDRLRTGMSLEEAQPIVKMIAVEKSDGVTS